jgi:hypothetical protein
VGTAWTNASLTLDTCTKACFADGYPFAGFDDGSHTCLCGSGLSRNSVQLSTSPCAAGGGGGSVSLYGLVQGVTLSVPFDSVGSFADAALVTSSGAHSREVRGPLPARIPVLRPLQRRHLPLRDRPGRQRHGPGRGREL